MGLWADATEIKSLEAAWHLTRTELRSDFFHDIFYQQAFANFLNPQLRELQRILRGGVYSPRPLRAIEVPKGPLSTRPGSVIPLRDRVTLWSIVRIIAPVVYKNLRDSVYSYRLKENPKQGELFKEGDALSIPFLKKKDIAAQLDPFEAWYDLWPDFEDRTKEVIGEGYRYLLVSDVAAYFENINLDILLHQLMMHLGGEPQLCNLVHDIFRTWTTRTHTGTKAQRGIPQGSGTSSFFGNIYLMPVDDAFQAYAAANDCVYIRYMDDMRIFCKDITIARKAAFLLEQQTRALHLNLQSSKTKILEEKASDKQISKFLFDDRVESLLTVRDAMEQKKLGPAEVAERILKIAKRTPSNEDSRKLYRLRMPGNDLTSRALRLWMNIGVSVGSADHIDTLLLHLRNNPDQRISKIVVNTCKAFPRHLKLGKNIVSFLESDQNIHVQQEAELLRATRYLSAVPDELWKRALTHVTRGAPPMVRIQSLLLLGMRSHSGAVLLNIHNYLLKDQDIIVHPYYMAVLGQRIEENRSDLAEFFLRHANPHNHEFGILLRDLEGNPPAVKDWLKYTFGADDRLADWQGLLWFVASSAEDIVRRELGAHLASRLKKGGLRVLLRDRLAAIRNHIAPE